MEEFDFEGFYDDPDILDDGMDHGDEYTDGFQPLDEKEQQKQWA